MRIPLGTRGEIERTINGFNKQALCAKKDGHTGAEDRKRKCAWKGGELQAIRHTRRSNSIERENEAVWKCDIGSSRENAMHHSTLRLTSCCCHNTGAIGRGSGQSPPIAHVHLLNRFLWFANKDAGKTPQ